MGRVYADNAHNRKLGRVGRPIGTADHDGVTGHTSENLIDTHAVRKPAINKQAHFEDGGYFIEGNSSNNNSVAMQPADVRMEFLRKVYAILTTQVAVMVAIATAMVTDEEVVQYVQSSPGIMIVAMLASIGVFIALYINQRETPTNFILLAVFTLLESYLVGVIVTLYTLESVLQALAITVALFVGLTLYTLQSERDFTSWIGPLVTCLWVLIIVGLIQMFFPMPGLHLALSVFGALVFCAFIVVDTQIIMSKVSEEDYIIAVVMLYLDAVNLFLHILRIFGQPERRN